MTIDFRSSQIQTNKIIASGSTGTNAELLIYGHENEGSPSNTGVINSTKFPTSSIGTDVFLFVSGSDLKKTVLGGSGYVSGNFFIEGNLETSLGTVVPVSLPVTSAIQLLDGATPSTIFVVDGAGHGTLLGINALPVASFQISDGGSVGIPLLVTNTELDAQNTLYLSRDFVSQSLFENVGDILTKGTASIVSVHIGASGSYLKSNGTTFNWEFSPRLPSKNISVFNYNTTDTNIETRIGGIYFVPSENSCSGYVTSNLFECVGFVVGNGTGSVTLYNSTDSSVLSTLLFSGSNKTYNSSTFFVNPTASIILEARCNYASGSAGEYVGFFGGQIKINYSI